MARRKSIRDIQRQRQRILTNTYYGSGYSRNTARAERAARTATRYSQNIVSAIRSRNGVFNYGDYRSYGRKFSRKTYMGLSVG